MGQSCIVLLHIRGWGNGHGHTATSAAAGYTKEAPAAGCATLTACPVKVTAMDAMSWVTGVLCGATNAPIAPALPKVEKQATSRRDASAPKRPAAVRVPVKHELNQVVHGFTMLAPCSRNTRLAVYACQRGHRLLCAPWRMERGGALCPSCLMLEAEVQRMGNAHA